MVRVRFAPSPTGYLHVGNARTALFNYLFARSQGGTFILRIEDTDRERSKQEYEAALMEDLHWLGVDWDEGPDRPGDYGPYRQMERIDIYKEHADKLLSEGKVYRCFCQKEDIDARNIRAGKNESSGYDNFCRHLTDDDAAEMQKMGKSSVLRFKVPPENIHVNDLIRGEVVFESQNIPDFVIMKADGMPIFHFAVVVDDYTMKITHVIRGEDHLSNTPKHIMLFNALGAGVPEFAHMAMTLGKDRTRLSKRHGDTAIRAYRRDGYLPEAFFNYIALLGWGTTDSQDIFSREELVKEFSIERCHKANAVFDSEKLLWMNGVYIRQTTARRILELALPFLRNEGVIGAVPNEGVFDYLEKAVALEQEKIKTVKDVPYHVGFFINEPLYEEKAVAKHLKPDDRAVLARVKEVLQKCGSWDGETLEEAIRTFCEESGYKFGQIFHPLRVAVSGKTKGPGLFEMLELLGRETVLGRIKNCAKFQV